MIVSRFMPKAAPVVLGVLVALGGLSLPRTAVAASDGERAANEHYGLASKAFEESDFARAVEELTAAIAARPAWRAHLLRAETYVKLSRYQEALDDYATVLRIDPRNKRRGEIERAMRDLATALKTQLTIASDPPGATVYVDMKADGPKGVTPLSLPTSPGRHRVFVELAGYEPYLAREVNVAENGKTEVAAKLIVKGCDLQVAVTPAGATVSLDGAPAHPGPLAERVRGGDHVLAFQRDGYQPRQKKVTCVVGTPLQLTEALDPIPPGRLVLQVADPASARVDGKRLSSGTVAVAPGEHHVSVEAAGQESWETAFRVESGQEIHLAPVLVARDKRARKSAWVWTGIGIAVAGVAIGLGVGLGLGLGGQGSAVPVGHFGGHRIFALGTSNPTLP
jgi:hypothetical protein